MKFTNLKINKFVGLRKNPNYEIFEITKNYEILLVTLHLCSPQKISSGWSFQPSSLLLWLIGKEGLWIIQILRNQVGGSQMITVDYGGGSQVNDYVITMYKIFCFNFFNFFQIFSIFFVFFSILCYKNISMILLWKIVMKESPSRGVL